MDSTLGYFQISDRNANPRRAVLGCEQSARGVESRDKLLMSREQFSLEQSFAMIDKKKLVSFAASRTNVIGFERRFFCEEVGSGLIGSYLKNGAPDLDFLEVFDGVLDGCLAVSLMEIQIDVKPKGLGIPPFEESLNSLDLALGTAQVSVFGCAEAKKTLLLAKAPALDCSVGPFLANPKMLQ